MRKDQFPRLLTWLPTGFWSLLTMGWSLSSLSHGPLHSLPECLSVLITWQLSFPKVCDRKEFQRRKPQSFIIYLHKWYTITSALYWSPKKTMAQCGRAQHKFVSAKRWGSLGGHPRSCLSQVQSRFATWIHLECGRKCISSKSHSLSIIKKTIHLSLLVTIQIDYKRQTESCWHCCAKVT